MGGVFSSGVINSHFNGHLDQIFAAGGKSSVSTITKGGNNSNGATGIVSTSDITGTATVDEVVSLI